MSTPKGSAIPALVVVELMGPLLSGADPLTDALSEVLAAEGLESRPGALEQARGMAARPALERMLEGHGRHDLLEDVERIESLLGLKLDRWQGAAPRLAAGAGEALARLASSGSRLAVITTLPAHISTRLAASAGLEIASWQWILAHDRRGLPHPDRLLEWFAGRVEPAQVQALVSSTAAALAATAAGCGEVIAVGNGGAGLLAQRHVASIGEYL